jgi:hypothetical protein
MRALPVVLALPVLLLACQANKEGPALPAKESMDMDMGAFTNAGTPAKPDDPAAGTKKNFGAAAWRVGFFNTAVQVALLAPRAVFFAALSVQPTFENGKWIWDFSAKSGTDVFRAVLSGWFEGSKEEGTFLDLEMKVTCTGCKVKTENYVWYTGRFDTTGTGGHWQFYNPEIAGSDQTFVRIDYDVKDSTHRSLTFTNKRVDGHADAGDTIVYKREGEMLSLSVHDASEKLDYTAAISVVTGAGWIQVPDYNGGSKACWDGSHNDAACQ